MEHLLALLLKVQQCQHEEKYTLIDSLHAVSNILEHVTYEFVTECFVRFLIRFIKAGNGDDENVTAFILKILGQILEKYDIFHEIFYENVSIN